MKPLQFLLLALAFMVSNAYGQTKTPDRSRDQITPELIDAWLALQNQKKPVDPNAPPKPRRNNDENGKPVPRPKRLTEPVYRVPKIEPITVEKKEGVIDQLKVAVVTYTKDDVTLDVIGTVHVADPGYYRMLNERFKQYDALCYELVAPKDKKPELNQQSFMRNIVKVFLDLDHQLAIVDYNADNFVHADFTPEKFQEVMEKNGDTMVTIALSTIADLMRQYNKQKKIEDVDPTDIQQTSLQIFGNPNASVELKRMMAQQFIDQADVGESFGAVLKTYILDERNKAALEVVEEQAKTKKKLGLFYGAAHLPDFDNRLQSQGWSRTKVSYDVAWDNLAQNQDELQYLFKLLQGLEEKKEEK